jgi:hypothetical protein
MKSLASINGPKTGAVLRLHTVAARWRACMHPRLSTFWNRRHAAYCVRICWLLGTAAPPGAASGGTGAGLHRSGGGYLTLYSVQRCSQARLLMVMPSWPSLSWPSMAPMPSLAWMRPSGAMEAVSGMRDRGESPL